MKKAEKNERANGRIQVGDIVQHFKRTMLNNPGKRYLYQVMAFATHTETDEELVVYKSLYADPKHEISYGQVFARPYEMFIAKTDREKYPDAKQEYRFETVSQEAAEKDPYVLTPEGESKVAAFIADCTAKRKEILDAGKDTADETVLPTKEAILSDLNYGVGVDDDGDYFNGWGVTDHYDADNILGLSYGEDFLKSSELAEWMRLTAEAGNRKSHDFDPSSLMASGWKDSQPATDNIEKEESMFQYSYLFTLSGKRR